MTDEERREHKRESQRKWVEKNPDYFREYRRMTRGVANAHSRGKSVSEEAVTDGMAGKES